MFSTQPDPHSGIPVRSAGVAPETAASVIILLHGRGATAEDILTLAPELNLRKTTFLAPQANRFTWYPQRFTAPLRDNEPWLSSALRVVDRLFEQLTSLGIPSARTILLGFSQGACLALEYAARFPRRFGGIAGLSGALIGPPDVARSPAGSLEGTPVFMGCSDADPHIPLERVEFSASFLAQMSAQPFVRIYPGMGHVINTDELLAIQHMAESLEA